MISKTILLATAGMLVAGTVPAQAKLWPKFEHRKIELTGINVPPRTIVVVGNHQRWTTVLSQKHKIKVHFDIKMKKGEVTSFVLKHLDDIVDSSEFIIGPGQPKNDRVVEDREIEISTGNLGTVEVAAVGACNNSVSDDLHKRMDRFVPGNFDSSITMEVTASRLGNDLTRDAFALVPFRLLCRALPAAAHEPPPPSPPPVADTDDLKPGKKFKVRSAKLDVHLPKTNACPAQAGLIAKFETNFDGKVTFIYRQAGGGKSKPITVTSKKLGSGKFLAVHSQPVPIEKATNTKYMVEVVGKGIVSKWATLDVPCKIKTGGEAGLATPPELPFNVLSAQLGIKGPKTKICPNKATMTAWFKTTKPGTVGFRLMRKDGPVGPTIFAQSVKAGSGYMATYTRTIPITKPVDMAYSVIVPGAGGLASPFVPLKASCGIGIPGGVVGN
jgi:hypothetical protein